MPVDSKAFPFNKRLSKIDIAYSHYAQFKNFTVSDGLELTAKTKAYVQKLGLNQAILLSQFDQNWTKDVFNTDGFLETLLKAHLEK